ncbi:MAG: hypothetical protein OXJ52_07890 [Oligoflexia bacterium]|nr:hypothetical protein [Oligoflexia bacterium]
MNFKDLSGFLPLSPAPVSKRAGSPLSRGQVSRESRLLRKD